MYNTTIISIKEKLLLQYSKYLKTYKDQIFEILANEGKKRFMRQIQYNQLDFNDFLISESYYITNLDLWLLSLYYKIPIILLSSTKLVENDNSALLTYKTSIRKFYFIKAPGLKNDFIPKYNLYVTQNENSFLYDLLKKKMKKIIKPLMNEYNKIGHEKLLTNYFENIKLINVRKPQKLRLKIKPPITNIKTTQEKVKTVEPVKKLRLKTKQIKPALNDISQEISSTNSNTLKINKKKTSKLRLKKSLTHKNNNNKKPQIKLKTKNITFNNKMNSNRAIEKIKKLKLKIKKLKLKLKSKE